MPNAFTPDHDGLNDRFGALSECNLLEFEFMVFDRWGELLFKTNTIDQQWDGRYKGKYVESGCYAWRMSFMADRVKGSRVEYQSGTVTVIR